MREREKPFVSVIMPTYNRVQSLTKAVDSVLLQTYQNYEIIVVDDGSTDGTKDVLGSYLTKIKYIHQENAGPAAARNTGIKASSGDWIAFIDSDDLWHPRKLERQILECTRLNADLCFHDLSFQGREDKSYIPSWNMFLNKEGTGRRPLVTGLLLNAYREMMMMGHLFLTTTFILKRRLLFEVGGFREDLRTSEDLELYFRLAARFPVAYVAETLATYSPGSGRMTEAKRIYRDRIKAIRISISDRIESNDRAGARIGKGGVLYQIRALAGEYRRSRVLGRSLLAYLYWLALHLIPAELMAYRCRVDRL